jgi:hypothetical protein
MTPPPASTARAWYLLIHQLPPRPLYLRAKIRRRLGKVGALAIKNSVYVLPGRPDCLEDFTWIAQEAVAGGGEACVCRAEFVTGLAADALVDRFKTDVAARYEPIKTPLDRLLRQIRQTRGREPDGIGARVLQLRKQVQEIGRTDFFGSNAGREVETLMTAIEQLRTRGKSRTGAGPAVSRADLIGRVWVTRADPHVDRLATAWLIRRFVDPAARFRFVDPSSHAGRPGELSFDMAGATFGHEGDRCSFETITARLGLSDPALRHIGEIVHDVDLKDGKFGRPDAPGVAQLVQGLVHAHADSAARVTAALPVFDALHASFGGKPPASSARARRRGR